MSSPSVIQMNIGNVAYTNESVGTNIIAIANVNLHENMIIHDDTNIGNNIINVIENIVNSPENNNGNVPNMTQPKRVLKSNRKLPPSIKVDEDKDDDEDGDDGSGANEDDKKSDMREKRENKENTK